MKLKKYYILFICTILYTVMLSGCGRAFSENDLAFRQMSKESGLFNSTITLMASGDWISDAEQELGSDFEAATGIQVIYDIYPDDVYLDTLFSKLDSAGPPDLFMLQSGFAIKNTYRLDKYALDLSDEPWMEYYDVFSSQNTSIDGRNYGMSYFDNTSDYYMVYNRRILEQAGVTAVPSTFAEFEEMCEKVLEIGVIPIYEPMADGWHQTMLFAETGQIFEKSAPGTIEKLNENKESFADNKMMLKSLEQIRELAQKGYMGNSFDTDTYDNAIGYLANGQYAMCMLRPGMISSILQSDMNKGYSEDDFGLMLLPICDNRVLNVHPTGPSKFICSASDNAEAAKLYLRYIASKDSVQYVINNSNGVYDLPFHLGQETNYDAVTEEFLAQFDEATSGLVLQDEVTYFNEQWGDISSDILDMCLSKKTAIEVLAAIDERRAELAEAANDPAWK